MKLESWQPPADKRHWKVVRLDTYVDVPGEIVSADEQTGDCCLQIENEAKTFSFGFNGLKLVRKSVM